MRTCAYVTNVTCSVHDPLWIDHVCVCVCVCIGDALGFCLHVPGVSVVFTGCVQGVYRSSGGHTCAHIDRAEVVVVR